MSRRLRPKGWQIEVPQDANGNRLVYVHCSYDAGMAALDVRTREVIWQEGWAGVRPVTSPWAVGLICGSTCPEA